MSIWMILYGSEGVVSSRPTMEYLPSMETIRAVWPAGHVLLIDKFYLVMQRCW